VTAPTFSQIKAQIAAIRQHNPDARIIGIRVSGRWSGDRVQQDGSDRYWIEQCDSPLAMRLALREAHPDQTIKVLLTSLEESELEEDILLRFARRKLHLIDSWQIVKTLFRASSVDPRLMRSPWIADHLLNWVPATGYAPVSGGFLDAETVWSILLSQGIGLTDHPPDLLSILKWSTDAEQVAKLKAAPKLFCESTITWLSAIAGLTTQAVLNCVIHSDRPDALPIGLTLGVLFHPEVNGRLDKAIGKLEERYLGGKTIDPKTASHWHQVAIAGLQQFSTVQKHHLLQRTDEILQEVSAESFAYLSDISLMGFEQRLARFGDALMDALRTNGIDIELAYESVTQHDRARAPQERRRLVRLSMAMRLVRWLIHQETTQPAPRSLAEAITYHQMEGGFLDWARLSLRSSDPIRELSEAYTALFNQVTTLREQQSFQFASLLQNWVEVGSTEKSVLPIEQILETIVAPLASQAPVLVIVMDGMSMAACRELVSNLTTEQRWGSLCQSGQRSAVTAGLAAIPSITEACRTSLLCGQLGRGKAPDEKKGFAALPSLLAHCRKGFPPVLFHKDALRQQDGGLADAVRTAITSTQNRIVGVVLNAIDDHLAKGDQLDIQWSQDAIKGLSILLHEAKDSNRLVVLLSDHGHVFDDKTAKQSFEGGERWRLDDGQPTSGELRISGSRVLLPNSNALIAPWTERLRYRAKNNGYHGGLSPQEMIVPIAVLSTSTSYPTGWIEAPVDTPSWWEKQIAPLENVLPLMEVPQPVQFNADDVGPLFAAATVVLPQASQWLIDLLASPRYRSRKKVAGSTVPGDDVLTRILLTIDRAGGRMTLNALSRVTGYPIMRVRTHLTIIQRILNVDGYSVVSLDSTLKTVNFDRSLLCQQFNLLA
jgi:hypothetical protein